MAGITASRPGDVLQPTPRKSQFIEQQPSPVKQRILVLGASGMFGHKLAQRLSQRFAVTATLRSSSAPACRAAGTAFSGVNLVCNIDAEDRKAVERLISETLPDVVVNAVGIVKQHETAKDPLKSIAINALLPHQLAAICRALPQPARLIHLSTDCVFSGKSGPYREEDACDPSDLYGRTKLLGEVTAPHCLTLRSSIVGRELCNKSGLVEWFLSQRGGRVRGFARALYTGLTTIAMSDLIAEIIVKYPDLDGLWQVASAAISKYELLGLLNRHFGLGVSIEKDETFVCDRRLDGSRFIERTGFRPPGWDSMIAEMRADSTPYD